MKIKFKKNESNCNSQCQLAKKICIQNQKNIQEEQKQIKVCDK